MSAARQYFKGCLLLDNTIISLLEYCFTLDMRFFYCKSQYLYDTNSNIFIFHTFSQRCRFIPEYHVSAIQDIAVISRDFNETRTIIQHYAIIGDVVLDTFTNVSRDKDNILDQIYS